jgi:hypothetical protein
MECQGSALSCDDYIRLLVLEINTLTPTTSLKDGLATVATAKGSQNKIPKVQATNDISELRAALAIFMSPQTKSLCQALNTELQELRNGLGKGEHIFI